MSRGMATLPVTVDMQFTWSHPKPSRGSPDCSFLSKRFACKCLICTASPHTFLSVQTHTRCCVHGIASFGTGVISSSPTGERCCTVERCVGRVQAVSILLRGCEVRPSYFVQGHCGVCPCQQRGTGVHHVFVCGGVRVYFRGCASVSKECRHHALLLGKRRYRSWPACTWPSLRRLTWAKKKSNTPS